MFISVISANVGVHSYECSFMICNGFILNFNPFLINF
jgi:hypothetical protein